MGILGRRKGVWAGKTRRIRVAGAQAWGDVILDGRLGSSHVITW